MCLLTTVISAQERERSRSGTAHGGGGERGFRDAQTLHWPTFYARPPARLDSWSFFCKNWLLSRAARTFFIFCNTSRAGASFLRLSVKNVKSIGTGRVFQWPSKMSVLAEGCRKNQCCAFRSCFILKIGLRNVHYFPGKTHTFQITLKLSMFFVCFWVGPENGAF